MPQVCSLAHAGLSARHRHAPHVHPGVEVGSADAANLERRLPPAKTVGMHMLCNLARTVVADVRHHRGHARQRVRDHRFHARSIHRYALDAMDAEAFLKLFWAAKEKRRLSLPDMSCMPDCV